jgi:hypothetical protein
MSPFSAGTFKKKLAYFLKEPSCKTTYIKVLQGYNTGLIPHNGVNNEVIKAML